MRRAPTAACALLAIAALLSLSPAAPALAVAEPASASGIAPPGEAAATPADGRFDDRLIVRVTDAARPDEVAAAVGGRVVREIAALDAVVVELPPRAADTAAARLAARHDVVDVERDTVATSAQLEPDDEFWDLQWGLRQVEAPTAWASTTGDAAVTIAVLDTGVETAHPDLAAGLDPGANFTDEGASTDVSDENGHGTHAAGVAAARTDNAVGIAGTCWTCRILPVKVLGADGVGSLSDIAAGMVWAVDQGADVLNLSLGSFDDVGLMRDAVRYAASRDVAMVASAGNFGNADGEPPAQTEVYPAAYDDVLGVAGNDEVGDRHTASSFGDWVEVTTAMCNPTTDLADGYMWFCGTSSSAPLVAGVIGLGLALEPDATREELTTAVTTTAAGVDYVEFGRVDAAATLELLAETVEPEPDPTPEPPEEEPPEEEPPEEEPPEEEPEPPVPGDPDSDPGDVEDGDEEFTTEPGLSLQRVSGANRFDTAARLSAAAIAAGGDRVYLATGLAYPDALAAGAAAGRDGAPVLLATRDTLPAETRAELARLSPDQVVVVGGTGAIGSATAQAAGEAAGASVHRIAGSDRFDTAARIAGERFASPVDTAFVATGTGFADALAGVPAAVTRDAPVLLATRDRLPDATRQALADLAPRRIEILGGTGAISAGVATELDELAGDRGVRRHAGAGRFETAALVSAAFFAPGVSSVHLATGADFPDALAGGAIAGIDGGPLLLVTRDQLPAATSGELRRLDSAANVVLGGWGVVSQEVEAAAGEATAAQR